MHAYSKWGGAFWRLLSLVDLGVEPGHPGAMAAAEETLEWVASPRRLAEIHKRRIDGRVRRCASQDGRALQACLDVGLRGDARLDTLAESLVETQWPDGGWNCDRHRSRDAFVVQRDVGPDPRPREVRSEGRSRSREPSSSCSTASCSRTARASPRTP